MKLIIASNNKGKIREYKDIFEPLGFRVFSQSEENIRLEVEATGSTFEQNWPSAVLFRMTAAWKWKPWAENRVSIPRVTRALKQSMNEGSPF